MAQGEAAPILNRNEYGSMEYEDGSGVSSGRRRKAGGSSVSCVSSNKTVSTLIFIITKLFQLILALVAIVILWKVAILVGSITNRVDHYTQECSASEIGLDDSVGHQDGDKDLMVCETMGEKKMFPDIGYSLYGYNMLFGYPMTTGRDPGYTQPIFKADYSTKRFTPDCRYMLPEGLVAEPGTSCTTSFSAEDISHSYDFQSYLDNKFSFKTSASAGGGGGLFGISVSAHVGMSFSANSEYHDANSVAQSGEMHQIISTAQCEYYFTKLNQRKLPPLSDELLDWLKEMYASYKTSGAVDKDDLIAMFNYFGTHFITEAVYGAHLTYEYRMSSSSYQSMQDQAIKLGFSASVDSSAKVSSWFGSASASFSAQSSGSYSDEEKQMIKEFQKNVTTISVSVGAPPPVDGDALKWASVIKESPVPVKMSTAPLFMLFHRNRRLSDQFSDKFVDHMFNVTAQVYTEYCHHLQDSGVTVSCEDKSLVKIPGYSLSGVYPYLLPISTSAKSEGSCVADCKLKSDCVVLSYTNADGGSCNLYKLHNGYDYFYTRPDSKYVLYIMTSKLTHAVQARGMRLNPSAITGNQYHFVKGSSVKDYAAAAAAQVQACQAACSFDPKCSVFSFVMPDKGLEYDVDCITYSVWSAGDIVFPGDVHHPNSIDLSFNMWFTSPISKANFVQSLRHQGQAKLDGFHISNDNGDAVDSHSLSGCDQQCVDNSDCIANNFVNRDNIQRSCELFTAGQSLQMSDDCEDACKLTEDCVQYSWVTGQHACNLTLANGTMNRTVIEPVNIYSSLSYNGLNYWVNVTRVSFDVSNAYGVSAMESAEACAEGCYYQDVRCNLAAYNQSSHSCAFTSHASKFIVSDHSSCYLPRTVEAKADLL